MSSHVSPAGQWTGIPPPISTVLTAAPKAPSSAPGCPEQQGGALHFLSALHLSYQLLLGSSLPEGKARGKQTGGAGAMRGAAVWPCTEGPGQASASAAGKGDTWVGCVAGTA